MRYIIAITLAALLSVSPALAAKKPNPDAAIVICKDVQAATKLHEIAVADIGAFKKVFQIEVDHNRCFGYEGAVKWKVMHKNVPMGYAKVLYDLDSSEPKIGFVPVGYIGMTGR